MRMTTDSSCFGSGGGSGGVDDLFEDPGAWPPGFRFHPTDEELILYYLKRKMCRRRLKLNVIADVDVYKWHPEELPGQSILKSKDRQWFFFSPRDRKYPNGGRSNRATRHGYWKATGKDRNITWNSRSVGVKKTLVFYKGRAPSGERTDWVMHEYTMEEEELKRCKNAQDSYALYKVFKKSGPGPKNGEQYGAPFREEDWVDDDELVENNTPKKVEDTPKLDTQVVTQGSGFLDDLPVNQLQVDDFNKFFEEFDNVHGIDQVPNSGFPYVLPQIGFEEGTESNMMGPSPGEVISTDPISWYPSRQDDAQTNFDATQSAFSCRPPYEAPEVTSPSNVFANDSLSIEDVGFLELNDLVGTPQINEGQNSHVKQIAGLRGPFGSSDGMNAENSHIELMNGLDGPELYFDPVMFLEDMGNIDQGEPSNPYFDSLRGDLSSQVGYQPPIQLHQGDIGISELWLHEQRAHVFTSAESNRVVMAPEMSASVSMVHAGSSTSPLHEQRQNQDGNEDGGVDSWFSSAISGFLASVPTRPALASESALNRAFERVSSFSRVNAARVAGVATGVEPVRRRVGRNGGFLFLSLLGVLCAVLWMFMIGTTVKILKTFFGRFIFS